jgi:hypothetical protein
MADAADIAASQTCRERPVNAVLAPQAFSIDSLGILLDRLFLHR